MSCHTILKYLYEPKMDVILTIRFKITAEIEKSYFADEDVYRRFRKHNYVLSFIHCHGKCVYIFCFFTVNSLARSSLNGVVCQRKFYGKGIKLKTFP